MFSTAFVLATLAVSASAATTSRTFAVNHFYGNGFLTEGRMDPIVSPGVASSHSHAIQGGSNFALTMSDTTLLDSTCTSSLIKNDKSVYWTPSLYFDAKNGSFISVPTFYMNVYYFFEATDDDIVAFQPGHRMFVGNSELRTPPASGGGSITVNGTSAGPPQPVQWTCPRSSYNPPSYPADSTGLDGVGLQDPNNQGAGAGFPDANCDGYASPLRADVHFPSCYNPEAGLDDYKNNMVFPNAAENGKQNCPSGYVHTPHIFYEVYWNTPLFADMWTPNQGNQPFVLSNGDNTGYSLHGDFIAGWDQLTLQQIIDNCDAGDSGMDKCPGLIGGVNDPSTTCNIPSLINEQVNGVLSALPGGNSVTGWGVSGSPPAESSAASPSPAPSFAAPTPASGLTSGSSSSAGYVDPIYGSGPSSSAPAASSPASSPTSSTPVTSYGGIASPPPSPKSRPPSTLTTYTSTTTSTIPYSAPASLASSTAASPASATNPTIPGWSYTGCYSDALTPRYLNGITYANLGPHNVTATGCAEYCGANGYSIAGTEYAGQCFCDNDLNPASTPLHPSECDMACEGDEAELCGGGLALSIYETSCRSIAVPVSAPAPRSRAKRHPRFGRVSR